MLVFAAYTPHSPLLLPSIGQDNSDKLNVTTKAFEILSENLYLTHPETIIIISAHGSDQNKSFSINLYDHYGVDFKDFGDFSTQAKYSPDTQLIDTIQRQARKQEIPVNLISDPTLNHSTAVPLLLLTKQLKNFKIIPAAYSKHDSKTHLNYGRLLKEVVSDSSKRIAVIASGDLSHCLSTSAPMGFKKEGKIFDDSVIGAIEQMSTSQLISINSNTITEAHECGYRSLLILMGLIEHMNIKPEILSYEAPFGVGYLVTQFHLL
ncbi:AmmeMemoRadiSam system protein B [Patescibacteria group bacterium]